jgi:putative DNA primase/helicase
LLAGDAAVSLDNCEFRLESVFLYQMLTQERVNVRVLGLSKIVETPANLTVFATGNNLTIAGDLTRRTLLCSLDAKVEQPELREFDVDVIEFARENRARLVVAALTVLRAWHVSTEHIEVPPFGSFEDWSHRIRKPLVWLGCADPCDTTRKVRSGDPARDGLATVMAQWSTNLEVGTGYTVQEVIDRAVVGRTVIVPEFNAALLAVAANKSGSAISNDRFGRWLRKVEGRIVDGLSLRQQGMSKGYPLWALARSMA